jgi:hypothetical protein
MLPIREIVEDGRLPKFPDAALAVYVTIAAHADRETGSAHPGFLRIAHLAGVSKSNVGAALGWLEKSKWLSVDRSRHNFNYRLLALEHRFDPMVSVPLRQRVVFSGLWAECPPSAKRAFIVLLSRSRMGWPGEFEGVVTNKDVVCAEIRGDEGCRHVPEGRSDPNELARLAGLPGRTCRYALNALLELGLTEIFEGSGEYLLPNTPQKISSRVLESLRVALEKDRARTTSRGARISAGRRRNRKIGRG